MAGGHVEFLSADVGRNNGQIAVFGLLLCEEGLKGVAKGCTAGKPQGKACSYPLGEGEELHFLADLPVIPLLGLFQDLQILCEHAGLGEGDAVDTGELLALFVASPVCTGEGEHLHGLDDLGILEVRAAAEVCEMTVGVIGYGTVFKFGDEFLLVLVAFFGEVFHGVGLGDLYALEIFLAAG